MPAKLMCVPEHREEGHQMHNTAGDTLLAQALQEEAAKALKDGAVQNPLSGVQFKEVASHLSILSKQFLFKFAFTSEMLF